MRDWKIKEVLCCDNDNTKVVCYFLDCKFYWFHSMVKGLVVITSCSVSMFTYILFRLELLMPDLFIKEFLFTQTL